MDHTDPSTTAAIVRRPAKFLDGRGAGAAWLILKVAGAIATLELGQILEVLGSDPQLMRDLPPVLEGHGFRLLRATQLRDEYRFLIAKDPPSTWDGPSGADV